MHCSWYRHSAAIWRNRMNAVSSFIFSFFPLRSSLGFPFRLRVSVQSALAAPCAERFAVILTLLCAAALSFLAPCHLWASLRPAAMYVWVGFSRLLRALINASCHSRTSELRVFLSIILTPNLEVYTKEAWEWEMKITDSEAAGIDFLQVQVILCRLLISWAKLTSEFVGASV